MHLKKGVNLGGFLSQCEHSEHHYDTFITEADLQRIATMGYDHVRLPIDYEIFETEEGDSIEAGFNRVHTIIGWAKNNGLDIVLDLHKAPGYDFNNAGNGNDAGDLNNLFSNEGLQDRFVGLWEKIASAYCKYDHVVFELLNEVVEEDNADSWNALIKRTVNAIRKITDRPIIYGGIQWNSARTVKFLEKPEHENIIFTFHFYEPLLFTHQKAYWVKNMSPTEDISYPESMEYYRTKSEVLGFQGEIVKYAKAKTMGPEFIKEMIKEAVDAAAAAGVPIYCGEFGVIDQAPIEDTLRWFKDVYSVFDEFDIGSSLWNYKEKDFGLIGEHYAPIIDQMV